MTDNEKIKVRISTLLEDQSKEDLIETIINDLSIDDLKYYRELFSIYDEDH